VFDYGDTQLIFEVRGLKSEPYLGQKVGNTVHLEKGTLTVTGREAPSSTPRAAKARAAHRGSLDTGPGSNHFANFNAAMRLAKKSTSTRDQ